MNDRAGHLIPPGALLLVLAGTFFAASCAAGPGTPTAPSAATASLKSAAQTFAEEPARISAASSQQALLLTKTCDAIDHCTVITSSSGPVPVGSDVNYFGPLLEARTTSRIVVTTPAGDTAEGHCSLSYRSGSGTCVLTDGTGALARLHANVTVSSDFVSNPAGVFTWDGKYHFAR